MKAHERGNSLHERTISVAIVDDHDLVREGIHARLSQEPAIEIVAEASNGEEAVEVGTSLKPDIMLMDISMPKLNGLEAARKLAEVSPETKILFLSIYDDEEYVREALRIGAKGFILKDVPRDEMINAIKAVARGGTYLGSKLAMSLATPKSTEPCRYGLTDREKEVLSDIAKGLTNREIADRMEISVRTVESHRASVREKTGGGNAVALAQIARDLGL